MDPFLFQQHGIEWLAPRKFAFLCDDPGLGKSMQAVRGADKAGIRKILVLTPAINRVGWCREFQRWQQSPRTIKAIMSSADVADLSADVLVVSYSLLTSRKVRDALMRLRFALLVIDEAQNLKNPNSIRTKATYGRTGLIRRASRAWALSGTLMPNAAHELWAHARAFGLTDLDYWAWVARYCVVKETAFGKQITGSDRNRLPELAAVFKPHTLRRRQKDVLQDLPSLRWAHVVVAPAQVPPQPQLTVEQQAILGQLERREALSIKDSLHLA
jgi:SNF2 family DNA or RNA helicase